jgi:hypothetical protein
MFEETLFQSTSTGKKMTDCLKEQNIVPGIKVCGGGLLSVLLWSVRVGGGCGLEFCSVSVVIWGLKEQNIVPSIKVRGGGELLPVQL